MKVNIESATAKFIEKFNLSGDLTNQGDKFIPGGYSRNSLTFGPHAIYVERGDGAFIQTVEGHKLLDFHNNFSCSILGHNHPAINEVLTDMCSRGFS